MPSVRICSAALLAVFGASPIPGQARYFRLIDGRDGLTPSVVSAIAQDRTGLLWIGTAGGLFRYDGTRVQRWAPDRLDTWIATLTVSASGEVFVIDEKDGGVLRVVPGGVQAVAGPDGSLRGARMAVFDRTGGLWVNQGTGLVRRHPETGEWSSLPLDSVDGSLPRTLVALSGEQILVATRRAVWRASPRRGLERLAAITDLVNARTLADGRVMGITFNGALVEFGDTVTVSAPVGIGRGIAIAERNGTLWASFDRSIVAIGPGGVTETMAAAEGITGSGPLLVDHEGSLWMGSWNGLYHFPEPDTRIWGSSQGLPSDHTRYVSSAPGGMFVDTWQGPGFIRRDAGLWSAAPWISPASGYRHHIDRAGRIWTGSPTGLVREPAGRRDVPSTGPAYLINVIEDAAGRIYAATNRGLFRADSSGGPIRQVRGLPLSADTAVVDLVFADRGGRLWVAGESKLCARETGLENEPATGSLSLSAKPPEPSPDAAWSCIAAPSDNPLYSLAETESGAFWATVDRSGLFRLQNGGWEPIPGARNLPTVNVGRFVPSQSGGFWVVGPGTVVRVIEDTAAADGWQVVERLTGWHGLPQSSASDVLEEPDGTLWIATMLGVVRVPAEVRRARPTPPRVVLVEGFVDEEPIALERPLDLPFERNRLRLRFAAVSFRDPSLLRYQVRPTPDHAWETARGTPEFRWVDLETGSYRAEVRASLDGDAWSAETARFTFRVRAPWYRTWWVLSPFAAALVAIAVLIHRSRVAVHVELERQRMRIAMDLHDELGSGLGSIGILAGVLRSTPPSPEAATRQVAGEIGNTAAALGNALSDIVWALDSRSGGIDAIAGRLTEHGNRLFPNGAARFTTRFPATWPETRLDLTARRNLLLIGVEALHNAARHSGASHVELSIDADPTGWTLEVTDNGTGMPDDALSRVGIGLASMRRRALQIGAHIRWLDRPGGGTIMQMRLRRDAAPANAYFPWRRRHARRRAKPLA